MSRIHLEFELTVIGMDMVSLVVGGSVVVNEVKVTTSVIVSDVVAVLSEGTVASEITSTEEISWAGKTISQVLPNLWDLILTVKGMEMVSLVVGGSVVVKDVNVTTSVIVSDVVAVLSDGTVTSEVTSTEEIS